MIDHHPATEEHIIGLGRPHDPEQPFVTLAAGLADRASGQGERPGRPGSSAPE